jgi:hypothetical protein
VFSPESWGSAQQSGRLGEATLPRSLQFQGSRALQATPLQGETDKVKWGSHRSIKALKIEDAEESASALKEQKLQTPRPFTSSIAPC